MPGSRPDPSSPQTPLPDQLGGAMQLDVEIGLLTGVSVGLTYEANEKHNIILDLVMIRIIFYWGSTGRY